MIVIWGGTGFIGLHTAAELLERGERVVLTTHVRRRETPAIRAARERGDAIIEPVDVTRADEVDALLARHRPDGMIDMSGYPPKALAPGDEIPARINGLVNILEAARRHRLGRITLTSSFDVYYGLPRAQMPFREDALVPLQEEMDGFIVQSWAKKSLEVIASMYRRQLGLDILTVRPSGAYGPMYRTMLNLPSRLVHAAVRGTAPDFSEALGGIPFAEDGYDQLYVKDIARAVATVHLAPSPRHRIYNVGAGAIITHGEFAHAIETAVPGFSAGLRHRPEGEPAAYGMAIDPSRLRDEFGFEPRYSLQDGVAEYAAWLRDHDL
jgi:UDP-glucose 4-epimerase